MDPDEKLVLIDEADGEEYIFTFAEDGELEFDHPELEKLLCFNRGEQLALVRFIQQGIKDHSL